MMPGCRDGHRALMRRRLPLCRALQLQVMVYYLRGRCSLSAKPAQRAEQHRRARHRWGASTARFVSNAQLATIYALNSLLTLIDLASSYTSGC